MSIARDEAERLYPIHRAGDDRAGFIQPAIDVLSQNAYACVLCPHVTDF